MTIVTAKLVKQQTADGLMVFNDDVTIGQLYRVDLDSIERGARFCHVSGRFHVKDIVHTEDGEYLPMECLEILAN